MFRLLNIKLENRVIGLDAMRSLAILQVLFIHYINFFSTHLSPVIPFTGLSLERFTRYFCNGFDGVDLFFVLSGFLIGHSLLKMFLNQQLNYAMVLRQFWIKRWFRTLPNYFVVLSVLIVLSFFTPWKTEAAGTEVSYYRYYIFTQNFFEGGLRFFPESWSLSIEEWFYISFPIILTLTAFLTVNPKVKQYLLLACILFFIIGGTLLRYWYTQKANFEVVNDDLWGKDIRTSVVMRLDAIIYGVLMAYFKIHYSELFRKLRYGFLLAGICILLLAFKWMFLNTVPLNALQFSHSYYFSLVGIGMAFLLPWFYHLKVKGLFLIRLFTFISVISYSVYLVNYSIVQHSIEYFISGDTMGRCILKCSLAVFFTVLISMLLYKFIETPFMNLRKRVVHES